MFAKQMFAQLRTGFKHHDVPQCFFGDLSAFFNLFLNTINKTTMTPERKREP